MIKTQCQNVELGGKVTKDYKSKCWEAVDELKPKQRHHQADDQSSNKIAERKREREILVYESYIRNAIIEQKARKACILLVHLK